MSARSEGSDETAHMHRPARVLAARRSAKHQYFICWPIFIFTQCTCSYASHKETCGNTTNTTILRMYAFHVHGEKSFVKANCFKTKEQDFFKHGTV